MANQRRCRFFLARHSVLWIALLPALCVERAYAGPPFVTDDPEPVEYNHWELYLFSTYNHTASSDFALAPAMELNYGVVPDVQLHLITPGAVNRTQSSTHFGYGDTELGIKYRFIHETDYLPEVGIFPLLEVPTGSAERGLGNGKAQIFLPLWLQKSFGPWTSFGGGGIWRNPGDDHRNFWRIGWELQRDVGEHLTLGGEIYHETSADRSLEGHTAFNFGGYINLDEHQHFLVSAGRDIDGPNHLACYIGFQLTF